MMTLSLFLLVSVASATSGLTDGELDALERGEPVPVVAIVPVVATAGAAIVANMPKRRVQDSDVSETLSFHKASCSVFSFSF